MLACRRFAGSFAVSALAPGLLPSPLARNADFTCPIAPTSGVDAASRFITAGLDAPSVGDT